MTELIIPSEAPALSQLKERRLDKIARKAVLSLLNKLQHGRITLIEDGQQLVFGEDVSAASLNADINVYHFQFYSRILFGGSIGAAEAYMEGLWSADDLTTVMRILALNRKAFADMEKGLARLTAPLYQLYHSARKNTKVGSRKNILAHYDLGNEFYTLFLDPTMTYSCGIFEHDHSTLEEASIAKYDRLCQKLELKPGHRVVEIGTGWGGFAVHAAKHYGVHVTTTTISDEQYRYAENRFREAGLTDQINLLKQDYRDLTGEFDRLVSIEMIEAVGHHFYNTFFQTCSRLLKADGLMALQAITIGDQIFDRHKRSVDFIKRYIFPGSCIPSVTAISNAIATATDLRMIHLEDITPHYARTLREWRRRFFANIDAVRNMGYPDTFIRMWEYYLCYCEGGFAERYIRDVQMLFAKPMHRSNQP
ncbi:MAG: class I SAM-dependent methyltransferase [Deltaproteobacteria bacterium]|jgi:cyclopropane-fatty-acyl-phospholipid synthase|nr:class I SAM-dependent methyltransferase [Deltaproteobacteria bacterium]